MLGKILQEKELLQHHPCFFQQHVLQVHQVKCAVSSKLIANPLIPLSPAACSVTTTTTHNCNNNQMALASSKDQITTLLKQPKTNSNSQQTCSNNIRQHLITCRNCTWSWSETNTPSHLDEFLEPNLFAITQVSTSTPQGASEGWECTITRATFGCCGSSPWCMCLLLLLLVLVLVLVLVLPMMMCMITTTLMSIAWLDFLGTVNCLQKGSQQQTISCKRFTEKHQQGVGVSAAYTKSLSIFLSLFLSLCFFQIFGATAVFQFGKWVRLGILLLPLLFFFLLLLQQVLQQQLEQQLV